LKAFALLLACHCVPFPWSAHSGAIVLFVPTGQMRVPMGLNREQRHGAATHKAAAPNRQVFNLPLKARLAKKQGEKLAFSSRSPCLLVPILASRFPVIERRWLSLTLNRTSDLFRVWRTV
jgi:hypothetical protein